MREKPFLVRLIYRNELNLVKIEQIFCEGISFQVPDVYIYPLVLQKSIILIVIRKNVYQTFLVCLIYVLSWALKLLR